MRAAHRGLALTPGHSLCVLFGRHRSHGENADLVPAKADPALHRCLCHPAAKLLPVFTRAVPACRCGHQVLGRVILPHSCTDSGDPTSQVPTCRQESRIISTHTWPHTLTPRGAPRTFHCTDTSLPAGTRQVADSTALGATSQGEPGSTAGRNHGPPVVAELQAYP